jgi:mannose-6-phosphate isomerase-like protein (cupin superfamily)
VERKLNAYYAEFQPLQPGKARLHHHTGVEFLSVLRGKLELHIGTEEHILESGDSIYFDSSMAHSYRRVSQKPCSAIVVTAP